MSDGPFDFLTKSITEAIDDSLNELFDYLGTKLIDEPINKIVEWGEDKEL